MLSQGDLLIFLNQLPQDFTIELNEKHCDFTEEEVGKMLKTDVMFIVDSDAHSPANIGKFKKVESIIEKFNIPSERVANLGKLPKFLNLKK